MSEMALTAERIVIVGRGRLITQATVAELTARFPSLEDAYMALTASSVEFGAAR
jgi:ABC-2 type transport system ATP-binding protein